MSGSIRIPAVMIPVVPLCIALGSGCTGGGGFPHAGPPLPDHTHVELVNAALGPVDPGFYVDGQLTDDLPLDVNQVQPYDIQCSPGDGLALVTQADLLLDANTRVASDNDPDIIESVDFTCGESISFIFVENGIDPFFTRVEKNGEFYED